jgi:hypothetical protein
VLTVQPAASPRLVGCDVRVEDATEKPVGVLVGFTQAPEALSQAWKDTDWMTVALGTVKVKAYVVEALGAELPIVTDRPVICAAETLCANVVIISVRTESPITSLESIFLLLMRIVLVFLPIIGMMLMMLMMIKFILSVLSVIAILCLSLIVSTAVNASPYGAGIYNADVPYGGQTQLTISTSGNVSLTLTPSDSGTLASASGTVTVISTDVVGYRLYARSLTSTSMTETGGAIIPASANGSPAALAVNTWGYNLDGSSNYSGMTLSDVLIRSATQPYTSGDVTNVTYGVRVDNATAAGNYTNSVIYTAVPQTN